MVRSVRAVAQGYRNYRQALTGGSRAPGFWLQSDLAERVSADRSCDYKLNWLIDENWSEADGWGAVRYRVTRRQTAKAHLGWRAAIRFGPSLN